MSLIVMFLIAVGLLTLDGCATAWLLGCRRRRRVELARRTEPAATAPDRRAVADARHGDLMRRQAMVRSQAAERAARRDAERDAEWSDVRATPGTAFAPLTRPSLPSTSRPISVSAQLLDEANLLAAMETLTYDPAIWDRRS